MVIRKLKYPEEEIAARGDKLYESKIGEQVKEGNFGKVVAIDVETGAFEVAEDSLSASDKLLEQIPEAQIWLVRIGHIAVHKLGFSSSTVIEQVVDSLNEELLPEYRFDYAQAKPNRFN